MQYSMFSPSLLQLIPIYACAISGISLAIFYISRLALRSPDVSYTNKREAEPWNYYRDREYKVRKKEKEKEKYNNLLHNFFLLEQC